jgi:hypothetical protein
MDRESAIFDTFIKTCPDFADDAIKEWFVLDDWYKSTGKKRPSPPFDNRPDVICVTESGKRIGVELKAWLNEEQIAESRQQEMFEENILSAVGELPRNNNRYIKRVWLHATPKRFNERDSGELRSQLFDLIREFDASWSAKPNWEQSCREMIRDLSVYPILDKYLDYVDLFPRPEPIEPEEALKEKYPDVHWITFPNRGGAYSLDEMLTPLKDRLTTIKNDERYRNVCEAVELQELYLLVHYDFNAFAYNTPIGTPDHSFKDTAKFATRVLEGDGGCFQRIFLLNCLQGEKEAHRLH